MLLQEFPFQWVCPWCNHASVITQANGETSTGTIELNAKYGRLHSTREVISCPNPACGEMTLVFSLWSTVLAGGRNVSDELIREWQLLPSGVHKEFPEYVPAPIRADYVEACEIRKLSPKASATLSRRALQGMIRDYWGVSKSRLKDEIDAIEDRVDPTTWSAIDAVRSIGNIGAHMERDINTVIDVDPEEAELLIRLIETLLTEWYVNRHLREQRMAKLIGAAADKKP